MKMSQGLTHICQNRSELEIRSFHWVKIILQQSDPIFVFPHLLNLPCPCPPPASCDSHLATLEHAKPFLARVLHSPLGPSPTSHPSPPSMAGFLFSIKLQTRSPPQMDFSGHMSEGTPQTLSFTSLFPFSMWHLHFLLFVCLLSASATRKQALQD